ncbi:unnamed protein product [Paramecium pentaurelia]|uniref:Uncharacterized protein n=1 Tax=Paramecium pentaurelia TaxID=43138 RepID=A0A8S1TUK2_9CILI|nr:unnamed protein product [Paramecium pentaurelia]
MSIIVVSTQNTQKEIPEKGTNFGDLIDEFEPSGKFVDYQFAYNGIIVQNISKGTKLAAICQGKGGRIEIQRKQSNQQFSKIQSNNPQPNQPSLFTQQTYQQITPSINQQDQTSSSIQKGEQSASVWDTVQQPNLQNPQQIDSIFMKLPAQLPASQNSFTPIPANVSATPGPFVPSAVPTPPGPFVPSAVPTPPGSFVPSAVPPPATFVPSAVTTPPGPFVPSAVPTKAPPFSQIQQTAQTNIISPPIPKFAQSPVMSQTIQQPQTQTLRKTVIYKDQINDEQKIINDYKIKITEKGNRVELESEKYDLKVVFLEENANEKIQSEIKKQLTKDAYPQDIKLLVKCLVGEQNQSTKVIFKKNFDGLAIQWATGLITLFDFKLEY